MLPDTFIIQFTIAGFSSSLVLLVRGVIGFIICTSLAYSKKMRAFPQRWNLQGYRLINAGLILLLVFESYKHLSATTVSLLQRMDIPFLIILSILIRDKKSKTQLVLSIIAIISTIYFISSSLLTERHELNKTIDYLGFALAGTSAFLLAFSYILLKKTSRIDNAFVITNITCMSTTVFGLIYTIVKGYSWTIHPQDIWAFILAAIILVASYYYSMELYKKFSAETAQLPSTLAIVVTMVVEMLLKHKWFNNSETLVVIFIAFLTTLIVIDANYKTAFLWKMKTKKIGLLDT